MPLLTENKQPPAPQAYRSRRTCDAWLVEQNIDGHWRTIGAYDHSYEARKVLDMLKEANK